MYKLAMLRSGNILIFFLSVKNKMANSHQVALKRVVDDFSDLAVEACLISKLPDLFSPERVDALSDAKIERIAAEGEEITEERAALSEKKAVLSEGLQELKRLYRHQHHLHSIACK